MCVCFKTLWFPGWPHTAHKKTAGAPPVPSDPSLSEIGIKIHFSFHSVHLRGTQCPGHTEVRETVLKAAPRDTDQEQVTRGTEPGTLPWPSSLGLLRGASGQERCAASLGELLKPAPSCPGWTPPGAQPAEAQSCCHPHSAPADSLSFPALLPYPRYNFLKRKSPNSLNIPEQPPT